MITNEIVGRLKAGGLDASSTNRSAAVYVTEARSGRAEPGWFGFRIICRDEATERRVRAILSRWYDIDTNGNVWRLRSKNRVPLMAIKRGGTPPTPPAPAADYMYFEAVQANSTVSMMSTLATAPDLEYSTDGETWQEWQHTTTTEDEMTIHTFDTITLSAIGDKVYLKGVNPSGYMDMANNIFSLFSLSGSIHCHGNAQTLVDGDNPTLISKSMPMFSDMMLTSELSAVLLSAPYFPATTVHEFDYMYTFAGCTGLVEAAEFGAVIGSNSTEEVQKTLNAFTGAYYGTEFDITDDNGLSFNGLARIGPFPILSRLVFDDDETAEINRGRFCENILGNLHGMDIAACYITHQGHIEYYHGTAVETNVFGNNSEQSSYGITFESGGIPHNLNLWIPTDGHTALAITPNVPEGYQIVKWQTSSDGETWTDVPDSSGSTFTIRMDTPTDYYYKLVLEQVNP